MKIYRGDTNKIEVDVKDEDGNLVNLTNYDVYFTMKKSIDDDDGNAVVNTTATIEDAVNGKVSYTFTPADTQEIGAYVCEFSAVGKSGTPDAGKVFTIVQFTLIIEQDVRRS